MEAPRFARRTNAPVQRRRDVVCSAPRAHNAMTRSRRGRDAVSPSAATGSYAALLVGIRIVWLRPSAISAHLMPLAMVLGGAGLSRVVLWIHVVNIIRADAVHLNDRVNRIVIEMRHIPRKQ